MKIYHLDKTDRKALKRVAELLHEAFPHAYKTMRIAMAEVDQLCEDIFVLLVAEVEGVIVGAIGAKAMYGHTGWELHPLMVSESYRGKGIGTALYQELESRMRAKGCVTMYLGTDDEFFKTSLSKVDLYEDTFSAIENIKNLDQHPYQFYEKMGFKIVGVIPDANGLNKPDILMAKRMLMQKR